MSASLATLSGPVCGRCSSGWGRARVQIRHESVAAVRACSGPVAAPAPVRLPVVEAVVELPVAPAPAPVAAPAEVLVNSAWLLGDELLRVKKGRSGRLYCVRLVGGWAAVVDDLDPVWEFASGAISKVRAGAARALSADEAARFGKCVGACVFCARRLDDTRSVNAGYGPVCAGNLGLPWG
jgi:hypothetical protein